MSTSTSTAKRANARRQTTATFKSTQKSKDASQTINNSSSEEKKKNLQSGKLSSRRLNNNGNESPNDSEEADQSMSNDEIQDGKRSPKSARNDTSQLPADQREQLSVSSSKKSASKKSTSSKNIEINTRKSTRRNRETDDAASPTAASENSASTATKSENSASTATKNSVASRSKVAKRQVLNFDTPSGDLSSSNKNEKEKKLSAAEEPKMESQTGARHVKLLSSSSDSEQSAPPATSITMKSPPASSSDHDESCQSRSSTTNKNNSTAKKKTKKRSLQNDSSQNTTATSSRKSVTIEEPPNGEEEDDSSNPRVIKFKNEAPSSDQEEKDSSDIDSRVSSRSSSIGVLLLSRTMDSAEGIMTLHSRSNSPQRSPAVGGSPIVNDSIQSTTNDLVLNLPDKARINSPKFGSDAGSSSLKESDADSSSIKPPGDTDYSDSMSPLSSSTDPSYSYLDEVPKAKLNVSKITNNREIYVPDETLESGYLYDDPNGQEFLDTDAEPSISHPDQTKKELLAELEKPSKNLPKSSTCLLL